MKKITKILNKINIGNLWIKPVFITINIKKLSKHIKIAARSSEVGGCITGISR